jgi:hypothetical protein
MNISPFYHSTFEFLAISNTDLARVRTSKMGVTLMLLNVGSEILGSSS